VKLLLDRIRNSHGEVKTQVSICRANYSGSFVQASTYMSREISRIFPSSNVSSSNFGKGKTRGSRNVSSSKQNGHNKGKRKGLIVKNNGVDISDLTRFYTKEEWKKLDPDVKKRILESPACKKKNLKRISVASQQSAQEPLRMGQLWFLDHLLTRRARTRSFRQ